METEISYNQNAFIFEDNIFLHLSGPIEQINTHKTSSPKGNDRSPDSKSSKYFEYSRIKDFLNLSRAANSTVYGWIRPNFKLITDYIVVLVTCKKKKKSARVLTSLLFDFSDAQGQLTPKLVSEFRQHSNSSKLL